jgi:hypothetical protein
MLKSGNIQTTFDEFTMQGEMQIVHNSYSFLLVHIFVVSNLPAFTFIFCKAKHVSFIESLFQ